MVSVLEVITYSAAFGYVFAEVSGIPQRCAKFFWMLTKGINRSSLKPFTCGMCLSFWSGLLSSYLIFNFDPFTALGIGFTASLTAVMLKAIHQRLL